jgi:hypothetical protein
LFTQRIQKNVLTLSRKVGDCKTVKGGGGEAAEADLSSFRDSMPKGEL